MGRATIEAVKTAGKAGYADEGGTRSIGNTLRVVREK